MVEMDYSGLKSKKYCNPAHSSRIEVLCIQDNTLCCADCAADHFDHLQKVIEIKSIFEGKQVQYRQLKMRTKILSKMQSTPDEIKSYVAQLLESSFDQIITRVAIMKAKWIEENFSRIMDTLGVELGQNVPNLSTLTTELEAAFKKIQNFLNSEETNLEEVMNLKQPEEFETKIEEIQKISNSRLKYKYINVNLHFEEETIKKMLKIEGINPIPPVYEGSVFIKEDTDFALSLLPPVRELKMIFSGKRDGMLSSNFHKKCDGVGDTLVLVKSKNGHSFGGFAHPPWSLNGGNIRDDSEKSFLLTCRNKTKHLLTRPQYAIYCNPSYGPTFGDLHISNNTKCNNYSGKNYSIPEGGKKEDYLSGPYGTEKEIEDYEVHQVIFQ